MLRTLKIILILTLLVLFYHVSFFFSEESFLRDVAAVIFTTVSEGKMDPPATMRD